MTMPLGICRRHWLRTTPGLRSAPSSELPLRTGDRRPSTLAARQASRDVRSRPFGRSSTWTSFVGCRIPNRLVPVSWGTAGTIGPLPSTGSCPATSSELRPRTFAARSSRASRHGAKMPQRRQIGIKCSRPTSCMWPFPLAAMRWWRPFQDTAMVEAVPRHGVKAASLYDYNRPFVVFRPSWSDRSHPDLVCRHARRSIGASYTTPLQLLTKLLPRWQSRIGGNAPHIGTDILICSTFVVQIFDDAWPRTVRSTASALLPGFPCSCLQTWWRRQASSRSHPDPFQPETLRAFLRG